MAKFNATQLEDFVRLRAPQIAKEIRAAADKAQNEADLVAEVENVLDKFDKNPDFDISLHLQRERTLINGRADAVYNRFVIEYEPPRSLQKSNNARTNRHAIDQVKQYIDELEKLDRQKKERLAGVVLDGDFYIFCRHRDGRWFEDDPLPVDAHSTETFIRYLLSLSTELALTPENLERDFGANSNTARKVVPALYHALIVTTNPKVGVLFQQWRRQFQEVSGYDPKGSQLNSQELGKLYAVTDRTIDLEKLFFTIHTYYATFIKLLALQIGYFYLMPKLGSGLASSADYDTEKLCKYLQDMEQGGLFAQLGIKNFLEGDFFGWYLEIWEGNIDSALRRLIGDLANYSLVTLDVDPEQTRDLLKELYQNLMPRELRHALGEYYTPDWLAERLLNQLGYEGNPEKRLLDPACGSGTFLVNAIKRIKEYATARMLPQDLILDTILKNIVGYDLNPLAVISTRTNYLLALGELLEYRKKDISIPVYICDSILTPSLGKDLFSQEGFSFNTVVGKFVVPKSLVEQGFIDKLTQLLEDSVHNKIQVSDFLDQTRHYFSGILINEENEIEILRNLYVQLLKLEEEGINGVWARIIKNAFAPLFQQRFDFIAGNPPWINWANLPSDYRQDIVPYWQLYGLFTQKGINARLGAAMDDISILMTYVAIDKYLKTEGKLGFVITQTLFKSEGGGTGFRKFKLDNNRPFSIEYVDDFSGLQVFDGATNRTSVLIVQNSKRTKYPLPYNYWKRINGGVVISSELSLDEVNKTITSYNWTAQPIVASDVTSSWFTGRSKAFIGLNKCLGESKYQARMGVHCHGNGYYWINIIQENLDNTVVINNIPESGRNPVEYVQTVVEDSFVYPLLRGRDVQQWSVSPELSILFPYDASNTAKAFPVNRLRHEFPKTFNYFEHFKDGLRKRSGYLQYFNPDVDPYYSMYNVGDYTFTPYKVVWRYIASTFTCAVIDSTKVINRKQKIIIPETKLVLVGLNDKNEAHYLCSCLSSSINRFLVKSYAVNIQIATHVLNHLKIPIYDKTNPLHKSLSELSIKAHENSSNNDLVIEIEKQIDLLCSSLWGLDKDELLEIQKGLQEY